MFSNVQCGTIDWDWNHEALAYRYSIETESAEV